MDCIGTVSSHKGATMNSQVFVLTVDILQHGELFTCQSLHYTTFKKDKEQYLATNTGQINLNVEASLCAQSLNH